MAVHLLGKDQLSSSHFSKMSFPIESYGRMCNVVLQISHKVIQQILQQYIAQFVA